eukprot:CAMPEP_0194491690 /NCGR_PEP_ID=MMETSP0253-20130528/10475_1 /TAXON_ID=2966 /ORGANISM="Noctiluca scintillans" /LENGTH=508 /DNA_ID=CAMNT_0039332443 /DNA_START=85 /DNA_END=1608 /DNA_ORIENTATION=-
MGVDGVPAAWSNLPEPRCAGKGRLRSVEAEIGSSLLALSRDGQCASQVLTLEVSEGARERRQSGEWIPDVVPADTVFVLLGGDAALVDPVLAGRRISMCSYGSRAGRHRVLWEMASRTCRELHWRAERQAPAKLYSLRVALLECSLTSGSSVVFDHLGQQIVDASGVTKDSTESILRPLSADTAQQVVHLLSSRQNASQAGSGHFMFHVEAAHANDVGSVTFVSVASLEKMSNCPGRRQSTLDGEAVAEHADSLERLKSLVSAFKQRNGGRHITSSASGSGVCSWLLLLAPPRCPVNSHLGLLAQECTRLCEDTPTAVAGHEPREPHLFAALGPELAKEDPLRTERSCVLPSPPDSEKLSWDDDESTPPSSSYSSPDLTSGWSPIPGTASCATTVPSAQPGPGTRRSLGGMSARSESLRQLQQVLACEVSFEADGWLSRAKKDGKSQEDQVQDLLGVIITYQQAYQDVVRLTQQYLDSRQRSPKTSLVPERAAPQDRIRWAQGQPGTV